MSDNRIVLLAAVTLFMGNAPVEIPAGTEVTFPKANSRDEAAEAFAQNQRAYADNRDALAHEEVRPHVFAEGEEPRKAVIAVTYGLHGARVEEVVGDFEEVIAARRAEVEAEEARQSAAQQNSKPAGE